ncbi:hypothetical protein H0H81_002037 [Sphagnurus paluster]|uniref:non-specific serine/threonine protein kinase n=1 Tax=Sphagnurus paluster TaxID=117069 RepID=A0A9P7K6F5_9AGAR|nr:hypothetical protein H0H81_002037 [Sphagnurus paluster]
MTAGVMFYVLAGSELVQVFGVDPCINLFNLLLQMKRPENEPSAKLKRMKGSLCNFYAVINPTKISKETHIPDIMASLQDTSKYAKVEPNSLLEGIATKFVARFLYLVIEDRSEYEATVVKLKEGYADLYRCLEIRARAAGKWTKDDIYLNGGIFEEGGQDTRNRQPPKMLDLEDRLRAKRSFRNDDDDPGLSIARRCEPHFASSYVQNSIEEDPVAVKNSREFVAFYVLLHCYLPDAHRYNAAASSSLKVHALKANFILPPFFSERNYIDNLLYHEEMPFMFPLFISCPAMSDIPWTYTPASDFSVWCEKLNLPLIIAEVVSKKEKQDRYRMLVQAISLARLAFQLRRPGSTAHPFIVAIYMTDVMIVERYILMQIESTNEVYITKKNFDIKRLVHATAFQREMYNLASELKFIVKELDATKRIELGAIKKAASGLLSLHSSNVTESTRSTTMDRSFNGRHDEDDLGIFGDDKMVANLAEMDCKVAYVAFGSLTGGPPIGCLKFVRDGGNEIEILHYLAGLDFESNHTVRAVRTWPIAGGSIIVMPLVGNRLTKLDDKDTFLWPVMKQLFEAVKFMHDNCVAHMDLKPSNLLIPSEYGTLTVIDFGVSVRVKKPEQLFQSKSRVGTEGYIAPEVGRTKFSPIRADLWSVGKVVEEFCTLCQPSPSRDWLLDLSKRLLDDDLKKRPMMAEVLQEMSNYSVASNGSSKSTQISQ